MVAGGFTSGYTVSFIHVSGGWLYYFRLYSQLHTYHWWLVISHQTILLASYVSLEAGYYTSDYTVSFIHTCGGWLFHFRLYYSLHTYQWWLVISLQTILLASYISVEAGYFTSDYTVSFIHICGGWLFYFGLYYPLHISVVAGYFTSDYTISFIYISGGWLFHFTLYS